MSIHAPSGAQKSNDVFSQLYKRAVAFEKRLEISLDYLTRASRVRSLLPRDPGTELHYIYWYNMPELIVGSRRYANMHDMEMRSSEEIVLAL